MKKACFITGTDTGVGKTEITLALMKGLQDKGHRVNAMKPIATGGEKKGDGLVNDDALRLQSQSSSAIEYKYINPYIYEPAIAPHIAAQSAGETIEVSRVKDNFGKLCSSSDYTLVEGIGGWHVPINKHQSTVDIAKQINLPIIMVVGFRLGCLNHALLTYQAIKLARLRCVGWVANTIDPNLERMQENYTALKERLDCPCIGAIPYISQPKTEDIAMLLKLEQLL